ncbi:phosphonate metabolism protein/1,5-bisphosphokinase (PRPP-forming) PhnN [Hoeflea olei]|uniref:Ribose 1,5-bisphosphate phosphokinase PhnN n=1 Tax=Hoeflea olei TaxID=1480615 RepID=A0A1C1YWS9_9HYPH|nr:phosphonate metabolism protein/1,5-bisphosphokinase (PRPP-forming) PhnN [Hoeflea olei]OCW57836.1 ribose-phosphate pyrophosphokinase [Hoeflea olei]
MANALDRQPAAAPVPGRLIVVLGPSGSGKDTLIGLARAALADRPEVMFVRRAITRPAEAGGEDHLALSDAEFDACIDEGRFALTWAANGLRYGLPRDLEAHLAQGRVAVVNGSRGAWRVIRDVFPGALAVGISIEPGILAHRLAARGRESATEIAARLVRASALTDEVEADLVIDNSGPAEIAGDRLVAYIREALAP